MSGAVHVKAGEPLAGAVAAGGTVMLGSGVHEGPLVLGASIVLKGEPGAVIDGGRGGPVVLVSADDIDVVLEGLELRGGHAEAGGGVAVVGYADVTLRGCSVRDNHARGSGGAGLGGGMYAARGKIFLDDCAFSRNAARTGSDLCVTGVAEVRVRQGSYAGDLAAREGATLLVEDARVEGRVDARGTTTRSPTVRLRGAHVRGGVVNDPSLPAVLTEDE